MDFNQNTQPEEHGGREQPQNQNQVPYGNQPGPQGQNQAPYGNQPGPQNQNQIPYGNPTGPQGQNQIPYGNPAGPQGQSQVPYGNPTGPQGQSQIPYGNPAGPQNQNQVPYGNQIPPQNQSPYYGNNQPYQSPYGNNGNYNNGYPQFPDNGYRQIVYPVRPAEPGSSLANAAMILGIIALICCFTFTVYPAFILGSIAILLALLSKGRRPALFPKAKTGIICATIGLVLNTVLLTSAMVMVFTNNELRQEMNEIMETQYGMSFDEMINEITEGINE